jgi:hypothetical protein
MKSYYVLTLLSAGSETQSQWTFSTREAALQHLYTVGICEGCKQDIADRIVTEHNPASDELESIVVHDALDTCCGANYRLEEITEEMYRKRCEAALEEMTRMWASEYTIDDQTNTNAEGAD